MAKKRKEGTQDFNTPHSFSVEGNKKYEESIHTLATSISYLGMDIFPIEESSKYAWYQITECSYPILENLKPSLRSKYLKLGLLPGPRRYEMGNYEINEHHSVVFEAIPALNEVNYTEVLNIPANSSHALEIDRKNSTPLLRFLELTDNNDPVPEMLIEFDDTSDTNEVTEKMIGRDIVNSLESIGGKRAKPDLGLASGTTAAAATWDCSQGVNAFKNAHCSNWDISYCHSGAWYNLERSSGSKKRKHSFTRVASCFGTTSVFHFYRAYWFGWKWFTAQSPFNPSQQLISSGLVREKHHTGSIKRRRKVKIDRANGGNAYFRAFISFHN